MAHPVETIVFQDTGEIALRQRPTEAAPPPPPDGLGQPAHGGQRAHLREDPLLPQRPPRDTSGSDET